MDYRQDRGWKDSEKRNSKKWILVILSTVIVLSMVSIIKIYNAPANRLRRQLDLGRKYLEEQNYAQAIVEFDKVIAIDPMNVEAYLCKAEAYIGLDDLQSALETLQIGYDETKDERIKAKIDELNQLFADIGNKMELEFEEIIEEDVETEPLFYNIDEVSILGCSVWDEDVFQNVCAILECPIIEKELPV